MVAKKNIKELTSIIVLGDFNPDKPSLIDEKYAFKECISIKISDSYETLTNTAELILPREPIPEKNNSSGYKFRKPTLTSSESIFKVGQRIRIFLGYDWANKLMFDGFVTSVESKTPFKVKCEDFGWKLKQTAVNNIVTSGKSTEINDLVPKLLEGTGIALNELTRKMNLQIGLVHIEKSKSVAEILEQWKRNFGLMSFIKFYNGVPTLALSRSYFSTQEDKTIIDGESDIPPVLDFQDNVVNDGLKFSKLDYNTLALEATTIYSDKKNSRLRLTLIRNKNFYSEMADYNLKRNNIIARLSSKGTPTEADIAAATKAIVPPDEFEVVNETKISKKKAKVVFKNSIQFKDHIANIKNIQDRFDLSHYNVRSYSEYNVDRDTLIKNAKAAFVKISQTGIDGSVTTFGDFGLRASTMVTLVDARNPEKDGTYIISSVETSFGIGGYRQKIKIPNKRG